MFEKLYGLSCIENHTLCLLREHGLDIRPLYRDCAVPMKELFIYFCKNNIRPEFFDLIPRVQDLARKYEIIVMERHSVEFQEAMKIIRNMDFSKNEIVLARIKKEFTKDRLHARGLRDNHYARVWISVDTIEILNDIPEFKCVLTQEEFATAYDDDLFKMHVNHKIDKANAESLYQNRLFKAEESIPFCINLLNIEDVFQDITQPKDIGIYLRNLTGVYKILRYRMAEYYGQYTDTSFIRERMPEVEKCYSIFEYYNLKSNISNMQYFEVFNKLNQLENEIINELKKSLSRLS